MRAVQGLILALMAAGLAGCLNGVQHNDVLIFGTDTKLAIDIGANPAAAGTPEITIGYKRQEAVWMPLVLNGKGVSPTIANAQCTGSNAGSCNVAELKYEGAPEGKTGKDAYSVFASFGANIQAEAGHGSVGLAQFFATGVAAQRLAQNNQVISALSVHGDQSGAVAQAAAGISDGEILARAERIQISAAQQTLAEKAEACARIAPEHGLSIAKNLNGVDAKDNFYGDVSRAVSAAQFRLIIDLYNGNLLAAAVSNTCKTG